MVVCKQIADHKSMPFIQLVGDQPVFTLITELKNENKEKFVKIMPVFGSFHLEMAFMNTIFKRCNGCGLSDLVVAAGLIEQGSVERALSGKHYKRCMRIHKLVYECLARRMFKEHLTNESDVPILTAMATQFTDENEFSRKREIIETMSQWAKARHWPILNSLSIVNAVHFHNL